MSKKERERVLKVIFTRGFYANIDGKLKFIKSDKLSFYKVNNDIIDFDKFNLTWALNKRYLRG